MSSYYVNSYRPIDVTNQTFGNRTQSNFNGSIDLDWVRNSNIIELTQTFCQSNTIERSQIEHFFNRTESNSRPIELCPWPAVCHSNRFHLVSNSALQSKELCVGFYFNHVHTTDTEKMAQVAVSETYNFRSSFQRLLRVLFRRRHSSFNSFATSATQL